MSIPTDKKGNVRKNSHNRDKKGTPQPYKKAKYIKAPNANLEVRKITK